MLKCPDGAADENEERKVNKMQLFGFMLETQRKSNDVFREKPLFPESKRKDVLSYFQEENLPYF